jgi:hypothetical protein
MFVPQVPLAETVLRVVLVYALIVVLVRLGGKRGLATMNTSTSWWCSSWRGSWRTAHR